MADYCIDNDNIINGDSNNFCIDEFDFANSTLIKPPEGKKQHLAQKFIFIDSTDFNVNTFDSDGKPISKLVDENGNFTFEFDETIKDVVEIELMSVHLPKYDNNESLYLPHEGSANQPNYLLLFIDNLDLINYKMSQNKNISRCFARLPIPNKQQNVFFGRIKNFTNAYHFKPILQSLNKLKIRITDRDGNYITGFRPALGTGMVIDNNTQIEIKDYTHKASHGSIDASNFIKNAATLSFQMTIGITYQTQPHLFDF